jgi:hypothetical protein
VTRYTYSFKSQFAKEFKEFPADQQDKVLNFLLQYEQVGLANFELYEGKLSPSWSGNSTAENYRFALENSLWHYHIGIPTYKSIHPKYKTSDWVLHFQWVGHGDHIDVVDLYSHTNYLGNFWLPPASSLA